jgi:hypothetical protein
MFKRFLNWMFPDPPPLTPEQMAFVQRELYSPCRHGVPGWRHCSTCNSD